MDLSYVTDAEIRMASNELSISSQSNTCLTLLNTLYSVLCESPKNETELEIARSTAYDELARFKIWAENIGALQPAKYALSLTQRLKKAPRTASHVFELLKNIFMFYFLIS